MFDSASVFTFVNSLTDPVIPTIVGLGIGAGVMLLTVILAKAGHPSE